MRLHQTVQCLSLSPLALPSSLLFDLATKTKKKWKQHEIRRIGGAFKNLLTHTSNKWQQVNIHYHNHRNYAIRIIIVVTAQ